jgi:enamine deaminase RidA (YjgF/YER057c/UK114 family)
MIPKKPAPDFIRNQFPAFAKCAPAAEGGSERTVLKWKLDCGEDRHLAGLGQPPTGAVPACGPLAWLAPIGEEGRYRTIRASIRRKPMPGTVEKRLRELGIVLQEPRAPMANYVPFVRSGNMLTVSGQVCIDGEGKIVAKGQLGGGVSIEDGQKAARVCAINLLAQVKAAIGDLDKVVRVVRLGGFVNSAAGFPDGPKVMNGASDVMVAAFGDKGKHARSTVGVAALPSDAAVEVEGLFEVS